jgi:hypothetical protein
MSEILIGCIKQSEADSERGRINSIVKEVLDYYEDVNLADDLIREDLALVISERVKRQMDKEFIKEYELINQPISDHHVPF